MREMRPHVFSVVPRLPERLKPLEELAYNLLFAWNLDIGRIFRRVSEDLWAETYHNPVLMLSRLSQDRIRELENDDAFLANLERTYRAFREYLERPAFGRKDIPGDMTIAYFSAEYGITDCMPSYFGGLGILAGDTLKSASDLNLPFVGVGLLYQYGAFKQRLTSEGEQIETIPELDFYHLPIKLLRDQKGDPILIEVPTDHQRLYAQIWLAQVGRVPLYLLDANIPQNPPEFRQATFYPYPDDRRLRLLQEVLLGIGGMRALKVMGIEPSILHMNEGHSALAGLERIRVLRQEKGLSFDEALILVMASNVFTTHTSVPAAIDLFSPELIKAFFGSYVEELGINMDAFLGLGRRNPDDPNEPFCMNILAMKLSGNINAVSKLHMEVSKKLWHDLWPNIPESDVPISSITNGVHVPSWVSRQMAETFDRFLGPKWIEDPDNVKVWSRADEIPDEEIWGVHERRRGRLIAFCRRRLREQLKMRGATLREIDMVDEVLNAEALTIVWAKRMVSYKRPLLIFKDLDRLARILTDPKRPVQIIMAGKAHPNDNEGKRLLKELMAIIREEPFRRHVVFIEDYDMNVARFMVQGADVWLNTPIRPQEACGTSGMKAMFNGALHLSVLDGWWDEAYDPGVGWAIGGREEYVDPRYREEVESRELYTLLENEIVPLFYDRGPDGIPRKWVRRMKAAIRELGARFNSNNMIQRYLEECYLKAHRYLEELIQDDMRGVKELSSWYRKVSRLWEKVRVVKVIQESPPELKAGEPLKVKALVDLGGLDPEEVRVDLYYGPLGPGGEMKQRRIARMELLGTEEGVWAFSISLPSEETGRFGYYVRVTPYHPYLIPTHYALGLLVTWG
ncbi:MAG: alpha-glucan phosphorylase [Deltaproteobacteria bacterium]|nr:MAG: alpha-glucan phosphorylase [Deltaproteobacteria bacterium]